MIPLDDYNAAIVLMDRIAKRARETKPQDLEGEDQWGHLITGKRAVIIAAQADGHDYDDLAEGVSA